MVLADRSRSHRSNGLQTASSTRLLAPGDGCDEAAGQSETSTGSRDPAPPITDEDAGDDGVCNARWLLLTTANKYGRHLAAAGAEINYVQVQTWIISILET